MLSRHFTLLRAMVLIFLATALSARARADGLTLDEAVSEAKLHSPAYRRAQAAEKQASWAPLEALSGNLPRVAVSANHFFAIRYQLITIGFQGADITFPEIVPSTLWTVGLYWTLFDGLQTPYAYMAAKANGRAARLELERDDFQLGEEVRVRYYQALAAQLLAGVAEENVRTLQDHLEKTREILHQGSATRFDLLRVQVQLDEAIPDRTSASDNVALARKQLAAVMGLTEDSRPLIGDLPVPDEKDVSGALQLDVSKRPDLEALAERADAADDLHAASFSGWLPRVGFLAEEQLYNNTNASLSGPYGVADDVGLTLTWNLFDGGATIARRNESYYQRQQAEAASDAAAINAPVDFETWKRHFFSDVALYRARRRAIDAARESVRLAQLGYGAGTRTSTDVLDAELDLFRARAGMVQAQLGAEQDLVNLELALGRKLENGL